MIIETKLIDNVNDDYTETCYFEDEKFSSLINERVKNDLKNASFNEHYLTEVKNVYNENGEVVDLFLYSNGYGYEMKNGKTERRLKINGNWLI